jgi:hypothetical protein
MKKIIFFVILLFAGEVRSELRRVGAKRRGLNSIIKDFK